MLSGCLRWALLLGCHLCGQSFRIPAPGLLPSPRYATPPSLPSADITELLEDAQYIHQLRSRSRDSFVERFRGSREIAGKTKDVASRKEQLIGQLAQHVGVYTDYELVILCWSLGTLGIDYADMVEHHLWPSLESRLASIDFSRLNDSRYLVISHHGEDTSISYKLLLFEGLAKAKVFWRKLSFSLKDNIESLLHEVLLSITQGRLDAGVILIYMHQIDIKTKDLSSSTKKCCKDAVYSLLSSGFTTTNIDFTEFVYAFSKLDLKLTKTDSKLKLHLKNVVRSKVSTAPVRQHWKIVHALGAIGIRWSDLDVNTRCDGMLSVLSYS